MSIETSRQRTAGRNSHDSLFEQISWLFMRLTGLILLGLALFHLLYMHFVIPGGVSEIDYFSIANRWTNPVSGFSWRFFDLSLLALGLSHGAIGVHSAINRSFKGQNARFLMTGGLAITYLLLLVSSAWIIFTFHG